MRMCGNYNRRKPDYTISDLIDTFMLVEIPDTSEGEK
jgi:hypothetical protein